MVKSMSGFDEYLEWVINTKNPFTKGAPKLQKDIITDIDGKLMVDYSSRQAIILTFYSHIMYQKLEHLYFCIGASLTITLFVPPDYGNSIKEALGMSRIYPSS